MIYILKYLILLIYIDQETILNWFGIDNDNQIDISSNMSSYVEQTSTDISLTTLKLVVEDLWMKLQDGLNLTEIENVLMVMLFVRFLILAIRYNLKTSFYITCISIFAGYLWYRHLIDICSMYRFVILKLPWVNNVGATSMEVRVFTKAMYLKDVKLSEYTHWYNPVQIICNAFAEAILVKEGELKYYIDPISMIVANLPEPMRSNISPTYYIIYERVLPKVFEILRKFWNQFSGIAAYVLITRIGKRYCPYLIRWHWTFLFIFGMVEKLIVNFIYRCYFFQKTVIIPQLNILEDPKALPNISFQNNLLTYLIGIIVISHIGFILFALLHAVWGQYFYMGFIVENVELHVGPRPTNTIYSGGQTSWQNPEEKEKIVGRSLPKFWYGWFGRGTKKNFSIIKLFKKIFKNLKK